MPWSDDQIEVAVMTYSQGCRQGKIDFLSEAFGIDAKGEEEFTITLRVQVSRWDDDGNDVDKDNVANAAVTVLDRYLSDELMVFKAEAFND